MGSTRDIKMGSSSLLLLAAALALASAAPRTFTKDEIEIRDCGSKVEFKSITMDGCTGFPCVVHHGEHATGKLTAVAKASTSSLTCKISGIIPPGIELPFNGCPVNACENLSNGDCPVEEGEEFVYDMDLPIENFYPTIEITGKWRLIDDAGENFLCFEIPIKIEA